MDKTVSVLITTYRRYDTLDEILRGWLKNKPAELWVLDGGGKFKTTLPGVTVFNMPVDLGCKMDYAFALLTKGDFVCLADDDVIPEEGFLDDLYRGWESVGGGIVGVIGRQFFGENYKGGTRWFSSMKVAGPVKTDMVGVVYFSPRYYFGFDLRDMHSNNIDDLYWTSVECRGVPKYVVPTKRYKNLPTAEDSGCMFHNQELRKVRHDYYRKIYKEYYEGVRAEV